MFTERERDEGSWKIIKKRSGESVRVNGRDTEKRNVARVSCVVCREAGGKKARKKIVTVLNGHVSVQR